MRNDWANDMIGKTFGNWTVVDSAESDKIGRKHFLCRCSCGKERRVSAANLRSGKSTSCGHTGSDMRRDDLSGQRFGRLTVLRHVGRRGGNPMWLCHCDCGKDCEVAANNLKGGHTISCGCRKNDDELVSARAASVKASPLTGRFESNLKAKDFCIEFQGQRWSIRNMMHFVRQHAEMFGIDAEDDPSVLRTARALYDAAARGYRWHGWSVSCAPKDKEKSSTR